MSDTCIRHIGAIMQSVCCCRIGVSLAGSL